MIKVTDIFAVTICEIYWRLKEGVELDLCSVRIAVGNVKRTLSALEHYYGVHFLLEE